MPRTFDDAISYFMTMNSTDFEAYSPVTVSEALAKKLVAEAMSEEGIRALQTIAERVEGKAIRKPEVVEPTEEADAFLRFFQKSKKAAEEADEEEDDAL